MAVERDNRTSTFFRIAEASEMETCKTRTVNGENSISLCIVA